MFAPPPTTHSFLDFTLADVGGAQITLAGILVAVIIFVVALLLSRLAVGLISRLRRRMPHGGTALYILEKFVGYGIAVFGVIFALSSMGLNLSSLAVFAGALGVGVGLGLQGVAKEFISGIVLLFDSIVNIGDFIEIPGAGGVRGIVYEIGARAIRIRTNDNVDVFVPNSRLIEERFTNWTLKGGRGASTSRSPSLMAWTRQRCAKWCWRPRSPSTSRSPMPARNARRCG